MQFQRLGFFVSVLLFFCATVVVAQERPSLDSSATGTQANAKPLDQEVQEELVDQLNSIQANRLDIAQLESRIQAVEGLTRSVMETRLDRIWTSTLRTGVGFGNRVADEKAAGYDVSAFEPEVRNLLARLPNAIEQTLDRVSSRIVLPDSSASAAEQAAADTQFFASSEIIDRAYNSLFDGIAVAERFGIGMPDEESYLRSRLSDSVANSSVYLDVATAEADGLRAAIKALPDDAELKAKLFVTDQRIRSLSSLIERDLVLMERLELPTQQYSQQLLAVTGDITTGIFNADVLTDLFGSWWQDFVDYIASAGPEFLIDLLIFILIIYVAWQIALLVQKAINRAIDSSGASVSQLLRKMISSMSRNVIVAIGVLVALSQIGISLGPLLAGLGIAGFVIGFALQDSLSNFASGLLILFYRPYDVGDLITSSGVTGRVSHMSLVNTTILTLDNQSLIIPNNKIWQDVIQNVTAQTERRVDMTFGVSYSDDFDKVEKILIDLIKADDRILDEPEPIITIGSFGDSSVNILCRPWVKTDDYWDVLWDMNKAVKKAFDREGVTIPFPQRDVNLFTQATTDSSE